MSTNILYMQVHGVLRKGAVKDNDNKSLNNKSKQ